MKKFENIDDLFSDNLADFGVQPPENAKDAIDAQLNKINPEEGGNNNRNYFYLIFGAMVILFAALFFNSTEEQKLADAKTKITNENERNNNTENTSKSNTKKENKTTIEDKNNSTENSSNTNTENKLDNNKTEVVKEANRKSNKLKTTNSNEDEYVKPSKKHKNNVANTEQNIVVVATESDKKELTNNRKTSNQNRTEKRTKRNKKNKDLETNNSVKNTNELAQNASSKNEKEIENAELKNTANENVKTENTIKNIETISTNSLETTINKGDTATTENRNDTTKSGNNATAPTQNSAKEKSKKQCFIEPFVGVNYGMNNYAHSTFENQQMLKDSIQFKQPIYTYGANVGSSFGNFKIKTGVAISQWKEQLGFSYTSKDYVTAIGDSIIINGTDTVIKHNIPVQILTTVYSANANKTSYTYLQIPVFIGYTIPINKLELDFTTGLIFNQLIKSKGNYKQFETNKVVDYSNKNSAPLRKNYFTAQLSIGASYSINDKIKLLLNLPFAIGLQSIYTNTYVANRKVNMIGAEVGVRFGL